MYTIREYGMMLADRTRMAAYEEAMRRTIRPGSVVVELGTGPGIVALLACGMGARKVYAIEPDVVVSLGPTIARANGLEDRVEFFEAFSEDVDLPERVDVLVSDLRGVLPIWSKAAGAIIDARQRFLAPGGTLMPVRDQLFAALVEDAELYSESTGFWGDLPYELDLSEPRRYAVNLMRRVNLKPDALLTEGRPWAAIDYLTMDRFDGVSGEILWEIERSGVAHGVVVWFATELVPGVEYSTRPGPKNVYGQGFFPAAVPHELEAEDRLRLKIQTRVLQGKDIWIWEMEVADREGRVKSSTRQSTFYSTPVSARTLLRSRSDYVPVLGSEGAIDRFVLEHMDGRSVAEIADLLHREFPDRFDTAPAALARVVELSRRYSTGT